MHGLGGNINSWKGSYKALDHLYHYDPKLLDYHNSQQDFLHATYEAHYEMTDIRQSYEGKYSARIDSGAYEFPPYAIGHSQGGLVMRDMDMKHDPNDLLDTGLDSTNRRFWGMITFATPHAGAYMAVRQDDLSRLGSELFNKISNQYVETSLGNLSLKHPLFKNTIQQANATIQDLINELHQDSVVDGFLNIIAKHSRDPISKQFGPESSYLTDTMNNYINPQMPKGLFYAVEEDPVMWRLLFFMQNDPSDYPAFQANNDDELANNMEDLRFKMQMQAIASKAQSEIYFKSADNHFKWSFVNPIGLLFVKNNLEKGLIAKNIADANADAADYLSKANMLYKTILGSIDDDFVTVDTVGWVCKKTVEATCGANIPTEPTDVTTMIIYQNIGANQVCDNTVPPSNNFCSYTLISTELVAPIIEETRYEIPSDATVLKPSQMAFPGCIDDYKRFMNERYNHATGQFETIAVPKVNHLQIRNCEETEAAMRRLYNGDGSLPKFFKLKEK